MKDELAKIELLRERLNAADAVLIGAGAGLSTAAGYTYSGKRFDRVFSDFRDRYGFTDMYSGGFYPYNTPEERWAFWSRNIYINRYVAPPKPVYERLLSLVKGRKYFVLTTNVDHCFQRAGYEKERLFYTQGDYGLFQCSKPCHDATYDNKQTVVRMLEAQGFAISDDGALSLPQGTSPKMSVPTELVPRCPRCGRLMSMNLRADDTFVQDAGWYAAAERYDAFVKAHSDDRLLLLELGVGWNTPGIIKYPFWRMAAANPKATYACLNLNDARVPEAIEARSIRIEGDTAWILEVLAHG